MSKYIKLEDAIDNYRLFEEVCYGVCKLDDYISDLPTIEVSEDCISREWVLNLYKEWQPRLATNVYEFGEALNNAPSVVSTTEQSSMVGEWKRHPIHENRAWDICTACGTGCRRRHYGFNKDGTEWVEEVNYPFCPSCGAKMKGAYDEQVDRCRKRTERT